MTEPEKPGTARIHVEGVGPLTRSTVGTESVPADEEALNDVLHWIWSWRLQIHRIGESFNAEFAADTELKRRQAASRFSFDEHILTVTGWNLVRAIKRAEALFPRIKLPAEQGEALRLLRHLYEHWDEQRPAFQSPNAPKDRSAAAFATQFPQGRPWTMVFDKDDWLLGGVLRLNELTRALGTLEPAVLALEAQRKIGK